MRLLIVLVCGFFIGISVFWSAYLVGFIDLESLTAFVPSLALPKTTAELGDSFGIINGFFSSLVVAFALIAILFQGKELRHSMRIQNTQSKALIEQLKHQEVSNRITALSTRLEFLLSEAGRMDKILDDIKGHHEKMELFSNCREKKKKMLAEAENIDDEIKRLLGK